MNCFTASTCSFENVFIGTLPVLPCTLVVRPSSLYKEMIQMYVTGDVVHEKKTCSDTPSFHDETMVAGRECWEGLFSCRSGWIEMSLFFLSVQMVSSDVLH